MRALTQAQDEKAVMMQTAEAPRNKISEVIAEGPAPMTTRCCPPSAPRPAQACAPEQQLSAPASSQVHRDAS